MIEIYNAISAISKQLSNEGISKDRSNQQQGYKFRGIDDCLNALASLLPEHGLVIIPSVLEREVIERQTKSGGSLFYVTVKVQFGFISTKDGSRHDAVVYGEAMDSADKATNKAMSAAYKYAVLLTFCIPTEGDNDADATTHEVAAKQTAALKAVQAKLEAKQAQPPAQAPKTSPEPAEGSLSWSDLANEYDTYHGGRKAKTLPMDAVTAWADQRKDLFSLGTDGSFYKVSTGNAPTLAKEPAFIWQIGKEASLGGHKGKAIETIPLDYLEWYVANGKKPDHLAAAKAELGRVAVSASANNLPLSGICEAYIEHIELCETVTECQTCTAQALTDSNLNVFEAKQIEEAGEKRLAFLRG